MFFLLASAEPSLSRSLPTVSSGHGPPRDTKRKLKAVLIASDLSKERRSWRVGIFGRRATRSKIVPLRMSILLAAQRLASVTALGALRNPAIAPSSAMAMLRAEGDHGAGTKEPSQRRRPKSSPRS